MFRKRLVSIYDWYRPLLIVYKFSVSKPAIIRSFNIIDTRDENTFAVIYNGNPSQCPNDKLLPEYQLSNMS